MSWANSTRFPRHCPYLIVIAVLLSVVARPEVAMMGVLYAQHYASCCGDPDLDFDKTILDRTSHRTTSFLMLS